VRRLQMLEVGTKAPDFELLSTEGEKLTLDDLRGYFAVLVFYPKNNTPG
jgi:peroxiredoxin Q/BCP